MNRLRRVSLRSSRKPEPGNSTAARGAIRGGALARSIAGVLTFVTLAAPPLGAQARAAEVDSITLEAIGSWIALQAQPGRSLQATQAIARSLPGWRRDSIGNLILRRGSGRPRRVVACGLDEAGYAVSAITDDGYLRVQYAGNARRVPLWDQFHQGQRIRVATRSGSIPGVVGVPSTHLLRGRPEAARPVSVEDLWVDIGAASPREVSAMGVELLDPVSRDWPLWIYHGHVAGPAAADRVGCAAVAAAARTAPANGETIFVISEQSAFRWAGLSGVIASLGEVDTLVLATSRGVPEDAMPADASFAHLATRAPFTPVPGASIHATIILAVRSAFTGTLVESVVAEHVRDYAAAVANAAGIRSSSAAALPLPPISGATPRSAGVPRTDSLASTGALLASLTELYAVSGHERPVREAVLRALPAWAQSRAHSDSAGNLILSVGPERDTVVFVAHMDEVGFDVSGIAPDGTVSLRRRGGFFQSLWEGQTALLHVESGDETSVIRGIFVPRDSVSSAQPRELVAWFGMDSSALVSRGVTIGTTVTSLKTATRLGSSRFTARSIDDRAGCTALIEAVRSINPDALTRRVVFVWAVREEIGLEGAAAAASSLRGAVARVYAVDTFVSSDSPLDSHRFAYTPIGKGPVVRALDNSSATPRAEIDRVRAVAEGEGIPIQVGTTNGGNDGSEFVRYGVRDVPISWPLRYSHSPAELVDLADIAALGRLVAALALH